MVFNAISRIICLVTIIFLFLGISQVGELLKADQPDMKREVTGFPGFKSSGLPYSTALKVDNVMFLSGMIGTDLKSGKMASSDTAEQTHQCMKKLKTLFEEGGMDFSDAVRATVYLTDINDYAKMNEAYASYFAGAVPPAQACVQVAKLVKDAKVEISIITIKVK